MSESVARDYVGRPDTVRRDELVARDYVTNTRSIRAEARTDSSRSFSLTRVLGTAIPTGAAILFGAYVTSRAADGSVTINGEAFEYTFTETLLQMVPMVALVLLVVAAVMVGPRFIGGRQ